MKEKSTRQNSIDFTEGSIIKKLLVFIGPLILTGVLQILYTAADNIIVGQFSGDHLAIAAIGQTGTITAMFINCLIAFTGGASIMLSQYVGARRYDDIRRSIKTAFPLSLLLGVLVSAVALSLVRIMVENIVNPELHSRAITYVAIVVLGIPALSVYNMGAAILRAKGNSKLPLYIGAASGVLNVLLNVVFVAGCGMSVEGVAIATVISQYASAVAILVAFTRMRDEAYRLKLGEMRLDGSYVIRMLSLGVPQAISTLVTYVALLVSTYTLNKYFNPVMLSAASVASTVDSIVFVLMSSVTTAVITIIGQNYGRGKYDRIKKSIFISLATSVTITVLVSLLIYLVGPAVGSLFISDTNPDKAEIIRLASENWFTYLTSTYFLFAIMSTLTGVVRGLGFVKSAMVADFIGNSGAKVVWMLFIFPIYSESMKWCLTGHAVTWVLNSILFAILIIIALRFVKRRIASEDMIAGSVGDDI